MGNRVVIVSLHSPRRLDLFLDGFFFRAWAHVLFSA